MGAAKIIKEINDKIDKCDCTKDLLENLNSNKKLVLTKDDKQKSLETSFLGLHKYYYPNYLVGNEELGSFKDPKSLSWSCGSNK